MKKIELDEATERQPQQGRGQECHDQVDEQAPTGGVAREPAGEADEAITIFPDDREHGTGLYHHLEDLRLVVVEPDKFARQNEMAGTRDRQKLGQTFNDPEQQGFEQQ